MTREDRVDVAVSTGVYEVEACGPLPECSVHVGALSVREISVLDQAEICASACDLQVAPSGYNTKAAIAHWQHSTAAACSCA